MQKKIVALCVGLMGFSCVWAQGPVPIFKNFFYGASAIRLQEELSFRECGRENFGQLCRQESFAGIRDWVEGLYFRKDRLVAIHLATRLNRDAYLQVISTLTKAGFVPMIMADAKIEHYNFFTRDHTRETEEHLLSRMTRIEAELLQNSKRVRYVFVRKPGLATRYHSLAEYIQKSSKPQDRVVQMLLDGPAKVLLLRFETPKMQWEESLAKVLQQAPEKF